MLNVSNAFNEAFKSPTRQVLVRITMKNIVYTNNDIFNVEYNGGSITGETFNIGSVFSNSVKITFTKVIEAVKQLDKIKLEFGIVLADGSKEFVSMGYFFVDKYNPDRNANRTVIEALDQMTQLERIYKSKLTYPARIKDVALEIANLSGSVVDQASFERLSTSAINKIEGKTYRQAIGLIAQFAGGFAIFDRDGKLSIRTLSDPNFSISTAEYFSRGLVKNETMYTLGGISCKVTTKNGDTSTDFILQSGSPLGNQIVLENSSMTQILLDGIYQQLKNTNYYPYTLSWRGNPALEAGDWISMSDTKANSFKMPNLSYKLSFSGGLKATSGADTSSVSQASASYRGPINQQLIELQGWKSAAGGWTYTGTTEPSTPKEGDVWFKPNGPDSETWIYEGGKWVFQTSTAGIRQVTEEMNQAQKDIVEAKKAANNAVDKANANVQAIEANTQLINDVNTVANNAKTQAQTAVTNANTAKTNAQTALDKADGVSSKVTTIETSIDTINGTLSSKANTTDLNALKGRVSTAESSITQNAGQVALKANQADVNTTNGKVSSLESSFTVQSGQISALNTKTDGHTTQIGTLESSYNGFKTTVANTYADKVSVASQINQSATAVTSNVQSWTDNKLTAYSTTQQTDSSITNAVADKADKSQITQLSNQITSTVTGLTEDSMVTVDMIKDANTKLPDYPDMIVLGIPATIGETYTVSTNKPNRGTESAPIADVFYTQAWNAPPSSPSNGAWSGHSVTTKAVINRIYLVFRNANFLNSFANGEYWVKVIAAPASQSQITQLSTDINLRVSKGDVTSQINIEAGRTLIDTKQLLLNANTVKFSGSAFIPDAMIKNLTASKINVGTLNGANVNIINLNASNISAGTITGPNLSINLNSGEVLFQKGIIKRQDGNFSVDITNGILESYTSSGGYTLRDGEISFRDTSAWKPNSREKYGGIGYNNFPGGIWSGAVSGISVRGNEGWAIGTSNSDAGGTELTKGSLIAGGLDNATFAARKKIKITAGNLWETEYKPKSASEISIGVGYSSDEILISSKLTHLGSTLIDEYLEVRKNVIIGRNLSVSGSKNAIHATRDGVRATPAYETAESYLGDIGSNYTRENCEVWIEIERLFSDTVNTDIAYQVFLQAYDDAKFWVADFKSDKFLIKSDKPLSRFAWEIKAKRRGYENDRLVLQDDFDNKKIEEAWRQK